MLTSEQQTHKPKQSKIRYTEYYDLQSTFDRLYADSLKGKTFHNLIGLMASEENIKLAYRTIKGNKGSGTPGVDKRFYGGGEVRPAYPKTIQLVQSPPGKAGRNPKTQRENKTAGYSHNC